VLTFREYAGTSRAGREPYFKNARCLSHYHVINIEHYLRARFPAALASWLLATEDAKARVVREITRWHALSQPGLTPGRAGSGPGHFTEAGGG
jgi:hypothetical protein